MPLSVVAIIAAYNEEDVIGQVVEALVDDGIQVYFIDHQSTDGTLAEVERWRDRGVIGVETFPGPRLAGAARHRFTWEAILKRKEQIAESLTADWFIHHDADEFRESPWPNETLLAGITRADAAGYNAIDFEVFNFWPTAEDGNSNDIRKRLTFYEPAGQWDRVQIKAWKKTGHQVSLAGSGGHSAEFVGRRVCPIRFLLRHYPIRSESHGQRKVFNDRKASFDPVERARGWHVQYDSFVEGTSFVRDAAALRRFDAEAARLELVARHRGVERLERSLGTNQDVADRLTDQLAQVREHLVAQDQEMGRLRARAQEDSQKATTLAEHLRRQDDEIEGLRAREAGFLARLEELADLERQIDEQASRHLDVDTLRRQVETQTATVERVRQERDRLRKELDALTAQLLAQDVEADRLRREVARTEFERSQASGDLAAKDATIHYLLASRSWRLTGPLRALDRLMRGRAAESTGRGLAVANLPLGGGLRLSSDVSGFWADGWAGRSLAFQCTAGRPVAHLRIAGRVPDVLAEGQDLSIEVGSHTSRHHVGPGSFDLTVPVSIERGSAASIRVTSARLWRPTRGGESQDDRELAWVVRAIDAR